MLAKLAARNVRRQIGNYVIYFITVSLTVGLMFAVNGAIFEEQLVASAQAITELRMGLIAITVLVSLIVAFVLGYATSFMLRLRKREFGTYLTLGMTRKNILQIFVLETLILCSVALCAGLALGLLFYQGLMAVITNITDVPFTLAAYSLKGLLLTVGLVIGVFALSSATSAIYLKRVSIYSLLHGAEKQEKGVKYPAVWFAVTVISLAAVIASCIALGKTMKTSVLGVGEQRNYPMFFSILTCALGIIFFHIGLAKSIVPLLLKNKKFKNRGTNSFVLRKLSGRLSADSVMMGALAFLIAFAMIGANVSYTQKTSAAADLDKTVPFDVSAQLDEDSPVLPDDAEKIISEYATVNKRLDYVTRTSGNDYLHGFTPWHGEGYAYLYDVFISESDFNRVFCILGYSPVNLEGGFKIIPGAARAKTCDFSGARIRDGNSELKFTGFIDCPSPWSNYFTAVVPDSVAASMEKEYDCVVFDLKEDRFDATGLRNELSYVNNSWGYDILRCDYNVREYSRITMGAQTAVFIVAALYISIIFVFMCMAILALKTLSGIAEDKTRYNALYKLGASKRDLARALFKQTFVFFFLPFALPVLLSIPAGMICANLVTWTGYAEIAVQSRIASGIIALVLIAVYALYYSATYLVTKRSVIKA